MITKTMTYPDFNGKERIEEFNFHLNKAELLELEASCEGGWSAHVQRIVNSNDNHKIFYTMKDLILKAYGVKSEDGRRFMKSDEIRRSFEESPAYEMLLMELTIDKNAAKNAADFINGIIPKDMPKPDAAPVAIPAAN